MQNKAELVERVQSLHWFHSIDLGDGIVTPGAKTPDYLQGVEVPQVLNPVRVVGASVLDVGAWNGFYSFECKRRGAESVTAADHFVWHSPLFYGRRGFDLANEVLGHGVKAIDIDVPDMTPEAVGVHDVVLFLGVLYHLPNPLGGLQRVAALARECLVVETHADLMHLESPAMAYYPGGALNGDGSNFFGPNLACVVAMLRECGFTTVDTLFRTHGSRLVCHAWRSNARRFAGDSPEQRLVA